MRNIWTTKNGEKIPYDKLSDSHLNNIISFLDAKLDKLDTEESFAWGFADRDNMAWYYASQEARKLNAKIKYISGQIKSLKKEQERRININRSIAQSD